MKLFAFVIKILLLFILLIDLISPQPFPTKFIFEKLSIENGLSSTAIYALHQDKTGFLWVGTENGLNRFDGYSFKIFKHFPGEKNCLSDNQIWDINEDNIGNLWIATGAGLDKYEPVTGRITHYLNNPEDSNSISTNEISSLCFDSDNNLWIGTWGGGFNIFKVKEKKFVRYTTENSDLQNDVIWCIFKDSKNNMWVGTDGGGLLMYNSVKKTYDNFFYDERNKNSINSNNVSSICEDAEGFIWIGTYGDGLNRYDYTTNMFVNFKNDPGNPNTIPDNFIWKVFKDSRGVLWIGGTSKGLSYYDADKNQFVRLQNSPYDPQSISSDLILDIFEDKTNILWIGTVDGGVNKISLKPQNFYHLKNEFNNANSLIGNFVFSICEDKYGDIWIANYGKGVSRYNPLKNKFKFYTHNPTDPNSISNNQARYIYEDNRGDIWIGTFFGGLNKYDRKTDSFIRHRSDGSPSNLSSDNIRIMMEDKEGNFWIGTNGGGLNKFDVQNNLFTHFMHDPESKNSLSNDAVSALCEDEDGYLWTGNFDGGLNRFDKKNSTFKKYFYKPDDTASISSNIVTYLFCDSNGKIWIGTWNGLNLYDRKTDSFIRFSEKDGLGAEIICGICEDKNGNLWISTVKGISKFSGEAEYFLGEKNEKKRFINFDINDGIQKGELNPGAFFINKSGWIYFGGTDGVNVFNPDSLIENQVIPNIVITSFKKFNEEFVNDIQAEFLSNLELNFDENVISFEFSSLDYSQPAKNQFAYKLEGFDKDWVYSGSRRYVNYTHLDPGEYIFRVKGTNNSGIWNNKGTSLSIIIYPPFWETWWFRAIALLVLICAIGFVYKKRISVLQKEKRVQEEFSKLLIHSQEEERKRIASELHDSLGQNLLIIKNRVVMSLKSKEPEFEKKQLNEISENASEAIDEVRRIAYNLHPYHLERLGLTKAIRSIVDNLETSIEINFKLELDDIDGILKPDEEISLYRIIQECANNIVKHSASKEAGIYIKKGDTLITINIDDDGKGFDSKNLIMFPDRKRGFGLKNLQERIKLLKGELIIDSVKNKGTKLLIKIPINFDK